MAVEEMTDNLDSSLLFNSSLSWQDWEAWGLLLLLAVLAIAGYVYIDRQAKQQDTLTHHYNRETGKVEPSERK